MVVPLSSVISTLSPRKIFQISNDGRERSPLYDESEFGVSLILGGFIADGDGAADAEENQDY